MPRPNILFLTSHDTGDWLGCYGHDTVASPHLDALAGEGVRFAQSFCTSPVCTPSRGCMMTGRYPQSNGLMGLIQMPYHWRYHAGEQHLSHLLAAAGYHTALFNHQHEAPHDDPLGFQERWVNQGSYHLRLLGENVATAPETAARVAAWLRQRDSTTGPFYAQVGFFETHTPYAWSAQPDCSRGVAASLDDDDTEERRKHLAGLQGAIRGLDAAVGQILAALADAGLAEDTIVVYTVDHGVELPRCKWELYDGGLRTALLVRWPRGGVGGGRGCDDLVSNVDIVPTLLELAQAPLPAHLEGRSFAGACREGRAAAPREAAFAMMHQHDRWVESRAVRTRRHKLIRNFSPSRQQRATGAGKSQVERPVVELYDLERDPRELTNLAADAAHAAVRAELDRQLLHWLRAVKDPLLNGPVITPYYRMAVANWRLSPRGQA